MHPTTRKLFRSFVLMLLAIGTTACCFHPHFARCGDFAPHRHYAPIRHCR